MGGIAAVEASNAESHKDIFKDFNVTARNSFQTVRETPSDPGLPSRSLGGKKKKKGAPINSK